MKLDCGPTDEEAGAILLEWHKWFAWHPVRVASHDCRWLEFVERRANKRHGPYAAGHDFWEYRAIGNN